MRCSYLKGLTAPRLGSQREKELYWRTPLINLSLKGFYMKRSLKWVCAAMMGLFVASHAAQARERYELNYSGAEVQPGAVIDLQSDLTKVYPNADVRNTRLVSVSLDMKSYMGYGLIWARTAEAGTNWIPIWGLPQAWYDDNFPRVNIMLPGNAAWGPWEINFARDHFRLSRIFVEVDRFSTQPTPVPQPVPLPTPFPPSPQQSPEQGPVQEPPAPPPGVPVPPQYPSPGYPVGA
jgi:hypothetical protein